MYDIELVKEILHQILWSAQTIIKRFASIPGYACRFGKTLISPLNTPWNRRPPLRFLVPYSACGGDEFRKEAFRCE